MTDGVALDGVRPNLPKDIHPLLKKLMEDCWDYDIQKRPKFNVIVDSNILDQIMIDYCVPDGSSSHFWKACFINRTPNDFVSWIEFVQAFGGFHQMDWRGNEIKGECLKALVVDENQNVQVKNFFFLLFFFLIFLTFLFLLQGGSFWSCFFSFCSL